MGVTMHQLLKTLVDQGGTDLHVTTNTAPQIRVHGKMLPLQTPPMSPAETKNVIYSVLTDSQKHTFEEHSELDELEHRVLETQGIIEVATDDVNGSLQYLAANVSELSRIKIRQPNLEDLFLELTGRELRT